MSVIGEYLDSRLTNCEHIFDDRTQPGYLSSATRTCPSMDEYGFLKTPIWVAESKIKE